MAIPSPLSPPPPAGSGAAAVAWWLKLLYSIVGQVRLTPSGPSIVQGDGAPTHAAPDASLYLRTDGGAGATLYVREAGAWVAK